MPLPKQTPPDDAGLLWIPLTGQRLPVRLLYADTVQPRCVPPSACARNSSHSASAFPSGSTRRAAKQMRHHAISCHGAPENFSNIRPIRAKCTIRYPLDTLSVPEPAPSMDTTGPVQANLGHSRSHPRPTQRRRRAGGHHWPFTLRPPPPPPNPFPTGRTSRARTSPPPWQGAQRKRRASWPWPCSCTRGPRPTGRK